MKKWAFFLQCFSTVILSASISSCSNSSTSSSYTPPTYDENGNAIYSSERGESVVVKNFPFEIRYNDQSVSIDSVSYYEVPGESSYDLYAVIDVNYEKLDEKQSHWLINDDLSISAYLTCEDNRIDFSTMPKIGWVYDSSIKHMQCVYSSSFSQKYSFPFDKFSVSLSVQVKQEEKYSYTSSDGARGSLNKTNELRFYPDLTRDDVKPASEMDKYLAEQIAVWLEKISDRYSTFFN